MERKYKLLLFLFAVVVVVSLAGFYASYLRHLGEAGKFPPLIHVHFAAFIGWFILVLVQPVLILKKQYAIHRKLGQLSYFLAPLLVLTIALLTKDKIQRDLATFPEDAPMTAFIGLMDIVSFSACYIIAMVTRRNIRWHVAFIIGATLIVLNPGMARLLNGIQPGLGLLGAVLVPFLVPIAILLFEKLKLRRPIFTSPYFVFVALWTFEIALFLTLPSTSLWQQMFHALFVG